MMALTIIKLKIVFLFLVIGLTTMFLFLEIRSKTVLLFLETRFTAFFLGSVAIVNFLDLKFTASISFVFISFLIFENIASLLMGVITQKLKITVSLKFVVANSLIFKAIDNLNFAWQHQHFRLK